jgi:beta-1,4-N-acetylglucosaminyltransferase
VLGHRRRRSGHRVNLNRLKKYGEVTNDHQLLLLQQLERDGVVTVVYEVQRLEEALIDVEIKPQLTEDKRLVKLLKKYITKFEHE